MHLSSGSFSSAFFSSTGFGGGLDGLAGLGALSQLGGLDKGLLSGGFGQLDQFGGVGGLGGDLVKTLFAASGFKMLGDMARLLSMAGESGVVDGARKKGRCGSGGHRDPMGQNRVGGPGGGDSGAPKDSAMAKLGPNATFEDLVEAFMTDEVKKFREEIKGEMRKLQQSNGAQKGGGGGGGAGGAGGAGGGQKAGGAGGQQGRLNQIEDKGDSRQDMMEAVKNLMNKLQQMQQAMSNVLNTMHQGAMNSVRNIRGN